MLKSQEKAQNDSVWNKTKDNERLFILSENDVTAPMIIKTWVSERIKLGLNSPTDPVILDALDLSMMMEYEYSRKHAWESRLKIPFCQNCGHHISFHSNPSKVCTGSKLSSTGKNLVKCGCKEPLN